MTVSAPGHQPPSLEQLREENSEFRVHETRVTILGESVGLEFHFTVGKRTFKPTVTLSGLTLAELERADTQTAWTIIRALSIIEAFSYWKAFCSPILTIPKTGSNKQSESQELEWWNAFWPNAMGEFFYRNGIDFASPGFLEVTVSSAGGETPGSSAREQSVAEPDAPALVMFSGGKDSLALVRVTQKAMPVDFFLYNPTAGQQALTEALRAPNSRIMTVRRTMLPELLDLNTQGYPNGHTPYSAYLAFSAMLLGYLRGNSLVLAGNSRSDDEPNVSAYLGKAINHQWTKSYEYEHALAGYRAAWLSQAPSYSSPLRPLYELQIIALLSSDIDAYMKTASCNKTKSTGWCRRCAKCSWVFLATSVLFGHEVAIQKVGADLFQDTDLSDLFERMAGLHGTKPFECTGTEDEVRGAIQHVISTHKTAPPALANAAQDARITHARSLQEVLAAWGSDDLVPQQLVHLIKP